VEGVLERPSVARVRDALRAAGALGDVVVLSETSRTAADAAAALGVEVGQIASSLVFALPTGAPLLVITSGRHRVDTHRVATALEMDALGRADAAFVTRWSGFSIGGVSPLGWAPDGSGERDARGYPVELVILIDEALAQYDALWAAGGHPHAVFPTTFDELVRVTGAHRVRLADE